MQTPAGGRHSARLGGAPARPRPGGRVLAALAVGTGLVVALAGPASRSLTVRVLVGAAVGTLWLVAVAQASHAGSPRRRPQRRSARSQAAGRQLLQYSADVGTVVDADLRIQYVTPSVRRLLGYRPEELLGGNLAGLLHPDDTSLAGTLLTGLLLTGRRSNPPAGGQLTTECRLRHKDGRYVPVETTVAVAGRRPGRFVLSSRDVTERAALAEQLRHQAFHDTLTGLANRALFVDRLRHALSRRRLADAPLGVLLLDLDDFKAVNDALGHDTGDQLLAAVADRLRASLRPSDTAARLGGDEFAVLLEDLTDRTDVAVVAARILADLAVPFPLSGEQVLLRASAGGALLDLDGVQRPEDLLRDAEAALHTVKGQHGYAVFTPSMHQALVRRLELTSELRQALDRNELAVHYQPVVELADGRIVGVEALLRWQHPTRGLVSPAEFIPLAEESGLIVPIGRWVLEQACAQGSRWQQPGRPPLEINVNLSLRQLDDPGFADQVVEILAGTGLPADALTLEITESFLAEEGESVIDRLAALKRSGIRLAIDDFGTGYSSLSRLRRFPIDTLKIPKPFIDGLENGADDSALARTITDLAGTLGLEVVAEGIEQRGQWDELRRYACRYGQGFFFARPAPAAELATMLRHGRLTGPTGPTGPTDHETELS